MKLFFAVGALVVGVGAWNYAFAVDLKFYFPVGEPISEVQKQSEFSKCSEIKDQTTNSYGIAIYECAGVEPLLSSFKLYVYENKTYKSTAIFKPTDMKAYDFNRALNVKFGSPSKKAEVACQSLGMERAGRFLNYCGGDPIFLSMWKGQGRTLSIFSVKTFVGEKPLEVELVKEDLLGKVDALLKKKTQEEQKKKDSEASQKYNF